MNKLERFAENDQRRHIVQPGKALFEVIKGKWADAFFGNPRPITLEIGCGRGEYTVGLARLFPNRNFIGADVKGARIWEGGKMAEEENLHNVAFLRVRILEIEQQIAPGEIDEIWVTFPDPRPKLRDEKRRLTSDRFLSIYKNVLKPGGWMHLKTDDSQLYEYTLHRVQARKDVTHLEFTHNLYASPLLQHHHGLQTRYEKKFLQEGKKIKYLRFQFKS